MPIQEFLLPDENIRFHSIASVKYDEKKYNVLITDIRIILYAQRGHISKTDDIISERLDNLHEVKFAEMGLILRKARITLTLSNKKEIKFYGSSTELRQIFNNLIIIASPKPVTKTRDSASRTIPVKKEKDNINSTSATQIIDIPKKQSISILSTLISEDNPTSYDTLGYYIFAYAVAKFISDNRTKPPIAISIQAPWGGGKTSVMNIIRLILDNEFEKYQIAKIENESNISTIKAILYMLKTSKKNKKEKKDDFRPPLKPKTNQGLTILERPKSTIKGMEGFVSIWFNPWKYESTDQIWSGLADSIITGIANRMEPIERKLFYLTLNLRERTGGGDISKWLISFIRSYIWKHARYWIILSVIGFVSSMIAGIKIYNYGILIGIPGIVVSSIIGFSQYFLKKIESESDALDKFLGSLAEPPQYNKDLGITNKVTKDLNTVFEIMPKENIQKPLIVFIDDLDRCSPNKVAEVFEGINRFISSEFQNCIFLIAMDTEMVAASLEKAHEGIISKIPKYSSHMPIGWKFMDKFIQLPIMLPPSIGLDDFIKQLIVKDISQEDHSYLFNTEHKNYQHDSNGIQNQDNKDRIQNQDNKDKHDNWNIKSKIKADQYNIEAIEKQSIILEEISIKLDKLSTTDQVFISQAQTIANSFSKNPREIKRFVNVLRFHTYLMAILKKNDISFEQVTRWIFIWLRWPQFIRWMYWNNYNISIKENLQIFEKTANKSTDFDQWCSNISKIIRITSKEKKTEWMLDENLYKFFKAENTYSKKLSDGAEQGIY